MMDKYITLMTTYGNQAGINFDFHGQVANTLHAHRLIQHFQEHLGPDTADKLVNSLYTQYFTQRAHPSASETLLRATHDAGIDSVTAEAFIADESEGLPDTKMLMREQASNGVDSVRISRVFTLRASGSITTILQYPRSLQVVRS